MYTLKYLNQLSFLTISLSLRVSKSEDYITTSFRATYFVNASKPKMNCGKKNVEEVVEKSSLILKISQGGWGMNCCLKSANRLHSIAVN